MLNRCEFIGNLGADPEVRRLASGDPVVNLRVAVTERWRSADGERKERTEWIPVTVYNEQIARVAEQYLKKGSKVFVAGAWQSRKWTDAQGTDRYSTEVVLQKFRGELQMLDAPGERQDSKPKGGMYDRDDPRTAGGASRDLDDEIPF